LAQNLDEKPRNHLVKLLIMLILLAADRSQHVQDQISPFVAHSFPFIFPRGPVTQFVTQGTISV
jgi:thymidylate kinase